MLLARQLCRPVCVPGEKVRKQRILLDLLVKLKVLVAGSTYVPSTHPFIFHLSFIQIGVYYSNLEFVVIFEFLILLEKNAAQLFFFFFLLTLNN